MKIHDLALGFYHHENDVYENVESILYFPNVKYKIAGMYFPDAFYTVVLKNNIIKFIRPVRRILCDSQPYLVSFLISDSVLFFLKVEQLSDLFYTSKFYAEILVIQHFALEKCEVFFLYNLHDNKELEFQV